LRRLGFGPALDAHGFLETEAVTMRMEGRDVLHVDYRRFPIGTLPIDIPQPSLIGIFHEAALGLPSFSYASGTAFSELVIEDGTVRGAVLKEPDGTRSEVRARLVVGADGRFSKVRRAADLEADVKPMARDFLSFKLPRPAGWKQEAELIADGERHIMVLPTFPDLLRIGHNLPKRGLTDLRRAGFESFRDGIAALDPRLEPLLREHLTSWDDTSFLEIFTAELDRWTRDGLVLIGDASHTCTPILGQGVNVALQDAVVLTPVIAAALAEGAGAVTERQLAGFVETRRTHKRFVTKFQRMQEAALAMDSPAERVRRRVRYWLLDKLPVKYRLFDRVINAQHEIDALDLELARTAEANAGRRVAAAGAGG
jgi:2-polyprenyl-6-methoxyphenol hydroxylase-like FAD-dependent oxidoreductase